METLRHCHRAVLATDIEGSTTRTNPAKARLRRVMYELLGEAFQANGITSGQRDPLVDRGDGVLALIHPVDQVPKTVLLTGVVPMLTRLLIEYNSLADCPLRLRVVVHAGELHYDSRGCFGETLDIAFRLLDAVQVKDMLRRSGTPLVLVVSHDIYRSVIRHGYDGLDDHTFEPLATVSIAGEQHRGWIQVPSSRGEIVRRVDIGGLPSPRGHFDQWQGPEDRFQRLP